MEPILLSELLIVIILISTAAGSSSKFNQRIHLSVKAIHYVDPTKSGFRVVLRDEFLRTHMTPNLLPTLYLTALPLRRQDGPGEQQQQQQQVTRVFYPDSLADEKEVTVDGLHEQCWHYLCIEWENFNRHNETTGTDCRLFRTLDRLGKGADSTVTELEATDFSSQMMQFRLRAAPDFPMRLTIGLEGGNVAPMPPAQVFQLSGERPSVEMELIFPYLRQVLNYGQLCTVEEPMVVRYTALGRLVSGISIRKCHFNNLTTTDYELSIVGGPAEASPYIRSSSRSSCSCGSTTLLNIVVTLALTAMLTASFCWRNK
uniref:Phosphatidylinositol-glycan biosynthesis class X protein n=1 Tax=Globodera rostochiensis TaxID=31243 RepID=A0A914GRI7_GLORO